MKVLFFFPNTANYAVVSGATTILAGIAKNECGWEVSYVDAFNYMTESATASEDHEKSGEFKPSTGTLVTQLMPLERLETDFQAVLDETKPDVLAISAMSHEYHFLRDFLPNIKIPTDTIAIIGGIHTMVKPMEVIESGLFDLICVGEGEDMFRDLLNRLSSGEDITTIENTYFRDRKTGEIKINPKRPLLPADKLWDSEEEYSFLDDRYFERPFDGRIIRKFDLEVGRGCPYQCNYCGNVVLLNLNKDLGKFVRSRPLDSVISHLKHMVDDYGIEMFFLLDECFLAKPKRWLIELAEKYRAEIAKPFIIQTRSETLTEEKIEILNSFGAPHYQVSIGVESGSEEILHEVADRESKVENVIKAFDLLHKHNIRSSAYFMVGIPFETREDIFKSIELCRRINPTVMSVNIFQPLPGQPLTDRCIKEGFITGEEPLSTFTETSVLKMPQITSEQIVTLRNLFALYAKLPKDKWPEIEKIEMNFEGEQELYRELVELRWQLDPGMRTIGKENPSERRLMEEPTY